MGWLVELLGTRLFTVLHAWKQLVIKKSKLPKICLLPVFCQLISAPPTSFHHKLDDRTISAGKFTSWGHCIILNMFSQNTKSHNNNMEFMTFTNIFYDRPVFLWFMIGNSSIIILILPVKITLRWSILSSMIAFPWKHPSASAKGIHKHADDMWIWFATWCCDVQCIWQKILSCHERILYECLVYLC